MESSGDLLVQLRQVNSAAAFNRWAGFEVTEAAPGRVSLQMQWRTEFGQYAGHLHAGLVSALIDTACGFAAFTLSGLVVASHCAVNYLAPGSGSAFVATAETVKAGRRQIFAHAELRDHDSGRLIANGQTILIPVA
ncbi:PaaI family thioesterase [Planomonospora sp. ID67723]|uniref:PaaI family thioesterase n=1 Tax=Planomonospora sp. ID67723 TaxID=2738134 RepID=UPI0018C39551|nr:PaaI family thioesterase [Planomonospora sp. ID67723]MBG0829868.1 PaaI family thioesterase [Planomonospora sp. ID67723]